MSSQFFLLLIIGFLSTFLPSSDGVVCYKCSSKTDDSCIQDPNAVSSGNVTKECSGLCTILRTEFTDIPGQVISFVRDCEEKPLILNEIKTDAHYTKYYRSCNKDKCNSDDGVFTQGSGSNGNLPSGILYVPEKSSSSRRCAVSVLSIGVGMILGHLFI